jgi:signal transduction histidine kinase
VAANGHAPQRVKLQSMRVRDQGKRRFAVAGLGRALEGSSWPSSLLVLARVTGLAVVAETIFAADPSPGTAGRHLVVLLGLVLAAFGWFVRWLKPLIGSRSALAISAIGLIGGSTAAIVSPDSSAIALPAIAAMDAVVLFSLAEGLLLVAIAELSLCVADLIFSPDVSLLIWCLIVLLGASGGLWRRPYRLRAEQAELLLAERQRSEHERLRADVADERARIARDVHDVLAHSLGALVVQLEAADALLEQGELARAREAVARSRAVAVDGLHEASRAVTALREEPVSLPDLLQGLAEQYGDAHVEITGTVRPLKDAEAGLSLYRAAQEALSNARKHASGLPVRMTLSFGECETVLEVVNDTPSDGQVQSALALSGSRQGLRGLRERAALLGGELHAGPGDGNWTLEMRVPQ